LFLTYENAKLLFSKRSTRVRDNFICGALAGGIASFLTTPLDVVKTRIMTSRSRSMAVSSYAFWWNTFRNLIREEGWRSLWRGAGPRISYKIASSAIFFVCFEFLRRTLSQQRSESSQLISSCTRGSEDGRFLSSEASKV